MDAALRYQSLNGGRVGEALVALDACTDLQIAQCLAEQLEMPFVSLQESPPLPSCVALISREVALEHGVLPIRMEGDRLLVAVRDPFDIRVDDVIRSATGTGVILAIAPAAELQQHLQRNYSESSFEAPEAQPKDPGTDLGEDEEDVNITTVEDPVEMQIQRISQIQVHDRAGRSFANALRSILRQDPDVIMVGEIRDVETTNIACRAALTGHLVISTLHAQHALGTVARLFDMGVEPWVVAACLNGVVAQRLVQRNCPACAEDYTPPPELQRALQSQFGTLADARFRRGRGCSECHGAGTRGRLGVYELLQFDEDLRHVLAEGLMPNKPRLWDHVVKRGFTTMEHDAFRKACRGLIPPEEVVHLGFGVALAIDEIESTPADPDAELSLVGR